MSGTTFSRLPVMIVALVIGLILTFTAVMPLVSDYSDAKTFSNKDNPLFSVTEITPETEYTFIWDSEQPTIATVNGEAVDLKNATVICSTGTFLIRYGDGGSSVGYYMQSIGGNIAIYFNTTSSTGKFTITSAEEGLTIVREPTGGTSTTNTYAYDRAFGVIKEGDWVMKSPTQTAYLNGDSEIIAMGLTTLNGNWANGFYISGTLDDGINVVQYTPSPATYTISDVDNDSKAVDNYKDLYQLKKITFNATQISDSSVTPVTYNFFIVPAEVSADPDNPAAYKNLVSVLPLFALILLVAGAASLVYFKNKD